MWEVLVVVGSGVAVVSVVGDGVVVVSVVGFLLLWKWFRCCWYCGELLLVVVWLAVACNCVFEVWWRCCCCVVCCYGNRIKIQQWCVERIKKIIIKFLLLFSLLLLWSRCR